MDQNGKLTDRKLKANTN